MGFTDAEGPRTAGETGRPGRMRCAEIRGALSPSQRASIIWKGRAGRPAGPRTVRLTTRLPVARIGPESRSLAPVSGLRKFPVAPGSVGRRNRLGGFVPSHKRHPPHPLLLEQEYWRNRLRALKLARPSALYTPRPDLSSRSVRVEEFRVRAFDGIRLAGLLGRRSMAIGASRIRLRIVREGALPAVDLPAVRSGVVEYALQFPAGRRLEDRVLDALRVCELAAAKEGVRPQDVLLYAPDREPEPDEFLIVSQLISGEIELESD